MYNDKTEYFKILVAVDGSENSMKAAEYAADHITRTASKKVMLMGLTVIDLTQLSDSFFGASSGRVEAKKLEEKIKEAAERLDGLNELVKGKNDSVGNGVVFESEILEDSTSKVSSKIMDYARRANVDLIVVGTHGRTGVKKMLLGSVATDVVTHAHCPVLVVR